MSQYRKLEHDDYSDNNEGSEFSQASHIPRSKRNCLIIGAVLIFSIVLNAFQYARSAEQTEGYPSDGRFAKTQRLDISWKRFFWHTEFSPVNHTESDHLWEKILPSHGFVAIDLHEAEKNGWPESMYLPSDDTKGVYLLEAYHQLHCLKIIRQTFWEAVEQ